MSKLCVLSASYFRVLAGLEANVFTASKASQNRLVSLAVTLGVDLLLLPIHF